MVTPNVRSRPRAVPNLAVEMVMVVTLLASCGSSATDTKVRAKAGADSNGPSSESTVGPPDVFVGAGPDGLGLYRTDTVELLRQITPSDADTADVGGLELSPDSAFVYYDDPYDNDPFDASDDCGRLMRVPFAGGQPEQVALGRAPALSPDGRFLGYVACGPGWTGEQIVIRTLASGDERVWNDEGTEGEVTSSTSIGLLSWSGESDVIAFDRGFDDRTEVRLLDVSGPGGSSFDGELVSPPDDGTSWGSPEYLGRTGGLAIPQYRNDGTGVLDSIAVVATKTRERSRVELPEELGIDYVQIASDVTGRHLLIAWTRGTLDSGLMRWSDGELVEQPYGVDVPEW